MKTPLYKHLIRITAGVVITIIGVKVVFNDAFTDSPLFCLLGLPAVLMVMAGPIIVLWPLFEKSMEIQAKKENARKEKELVEEQKLTHQRMMNETKTYNLWDPKPWKDNTKTIEKTKAKLVGSYNSINATWNDRPATLHFEYERGGYSDDISFDEFSAIRTARDTSGEYVPFAKLYLISNRDVVLFYYYDDWYITHEQIDMDDAVVLIKATNLKNEERLQRSIERAKRALEGNTQDPARQGIPDDVKSFVWNRDGGKCVNCGSNQNLEFDHIIPISKGGSNTARNIQLLCEECNRKKSNKIG